MTRPAKKPTNAVNDAMTALLREAVIRDLRYTSRNSNSFGYYTPDKKSLLSNLDDDLALCPSCFDVSQSLIGRFEWKDPIHHRPNNPGIDEASNLA